MPFPGHPLSAPLSRLRICSVSFQSQWKNHTSPVKFLPPLSHGKAGFTPQGLCGPCFCCSAHLTVFSPSSPRNYPSLRNPHTQIVRIWCFARCRHLLHTALGCIWVRKAEGCRRRRLVRCGRWPDPTWEFRIQILVTLLPQGRVSGGIWDFVFHWSWRGLSDCTMKPGAGGERQLPCFAWGAGGGKRERIF